MYTNHVLRSGSHTLILCLAILLAGCASTQKRYDKAQDLEDQGRYAEAAAYYVKILEKEPDWEEAQDRLLEVGDRAVTAFIEDAEAAADRGDYEEAIGNLDRLDDLRDEARDVGVVLPVPEDYATYRQELNDRAVETLVQRGERAEERGDWDEALQAYERAATYLITPGRLAEFERRQASVHIRWGEQDAEHERYRAAFGRVQQALEVLDPEDPLARRARDLQQAVLEAGTRFVAFLPFWGTDEVNREAPDPLVQDLNDVLLYDHWSEPVPFIAVADPVQLRRELRRLRYDRTIITRNQAAEIGRTAEADYVVVGELTGFERRERNVKDRNRSARLKGRGSTVTGSKDVTYVEQRFTLELKADVTYRIIDPRTRRVVDQGKVDGRVSGSAKRGVYEGDYQDLDLDGSALSLFEDEERLATEELVNELVDVLAERLAPRLYDRLLRQIL